MKSIRNIALSAFLTLGAFGAVTYTSCNKDECKDVVCQNGGTCVDGRCQCTAGYEGSNCETASASRLPGSYVASETCQPPVSGGQTWSSTVTQSSNDKTRIVIQNFGNSNTSVTAFINSNAITIDPVSISGKNVTGTGTVNGNILTINYELNGGATNYKCTMTMTRQ
jgi:hypothetical protein